MSRRERPAPPLAEWLIGGDWSSRAVRPRVPALADGELVNGVERGVTGRNWDGSSDSFIETPEQYCALQFHEDDMVDAGWSYDLDFTLPATLRSGVYAVKLSGGRGGRALSAFRAGCSRRCRAGAVPGIDQYVPRLCQ